MDSSQVFLALHNSDRLHILREIGLLDGAPEPAFDRLARLACRLLRAPVCLISLVEEERQQFAGCVGLAEPWCSSRQTPLSHSFCQYVVVDRAPFVVADARLHPLVADNLAIPDLGVIAYAGVPLLTPEGVALGALCAIDHTPRDWSEDDLERERRCFIAVSVITAPRILASGAQLLAREAGSATPLAAAQGSARLFGRRFELLN